MNPGEKHEQHCILAIDDEHEMLDLVRTTLEGDGFEVHTACRPQDAITLYEEKWREIGVVVSDYKMPGMTGEVVLDHLRQINPDMRAILMTGFYGNRIVASMFSKGLRGCIEKPFHLEELSEEVRAVMAAS